MAWFSLFEKTEEEIVLILDVGSIAVGAAVAHFKKGSRPGILWQSREVIRFGHNPDHGQFLSSVNRAIENLLGRAEKAGVMAIVLSGLKQSFFDRAVCVLSSPYHVSSTRLINLNYSKPLTLSRDFLAEIVNREEQDFKTEVLGDIDDISEVFNQFEVIDQKIIRALVNGYKVVNLDNHRASTVELAVFFSLAPAPLTRQIRKTVQKYFPVDRFDFHSFTLAAVSVLRDLFPGERSFLTVEVGGETTELSIINNEVITQSASFPLGQNFVVRQILKLIPALSPGLAISIIKNHADGRSGGGFSAKLAEVLGRVENDWIGCFREIATNFAKNKALPKSVFVFGSDDSVDLFSGLIKKSAVKFEAGLPRIWSVTNGHFEPFCNFQLDSGIDPRLPMEAIFADRLWSL
jgi:hypothetical protein